MTNVNNTSNGHNHTEKISTSLQTIPNHSFSSTSSSSVTSSSPFPASHSTSNSDQAQRIHLFSLVHFCEQSGPSIVFVTQTHSLPSSHFSLSDGPLDNTENIKPSSFLCSLEKKEELTSNHQNGEATTKVDLSLKRISELHSSFSKSTSLPSALVDSPTLVISSTSSDSSNSSSSSSPQIHSFISSESPKQTSTSNISTSTLSSPSPKSSLPSTTTCLTCYPTLPSSTTLDSAFQACLQAFPSFTPTFSNSSNSSSSSKILSEPSIPSGSKFYLASPLFQNTFLVSTRHPLDQELYPILKTACVRSLSCELTLHRVGPVYFTFQLPGYLQTYHTLTYYFQLSDATSRGNVRTFAFIYLSSFKEKVVVHWDSLVSHFSNMANQLSSLAEKVTLGEFNIIESSDSNHIQELTPQRFLKGRGIGSDLPRLKPLTEMLGIDTAFITLHLHFATLIRDTLFGSETDNIPSFSETMPPLKVSPSSPGESTNLGILSLPWIALPTSFTSHLLCTSSTTSSSCSSSSSSPNSSISSYFGLDPLLWPTGCEAVFQCLLNRLGHSKLVILLTHVVTGDQLILRGNQRESLPLANALAYLLPKPCARILVANAYRHSWECNILCIDEHIPIPTDTLKKDLAGYILVDVEASNVFIVDAVRSMVFNPDTPKLAFHYSQAMDSPCSTMLAHLTMVKFKWMHLALQYHFLHQVHMEHFLKKKPQLHHSQMTHSPNFTKEKIRMHPSDRKSSIPSTSYSSFSSVSPSNKWRYPSSYPNIHSNSVSTHNHASSSSSSSSSSSKSSCSSSPNTPTHSTSSSSSSSTPLNTSSVYPSSNSSFGHSNFNGISSHALWMDSQEEEAEYDEVDLLVLRFWARTYRSTTTIS